MGHDYRLGAKRSACNLTTEVPAVSELVDVQSQFRLQVAGFVFVNHISLSQLVEHRRNLAVQCGGVVLHGHGAEFAHGVAGGFSVVSVAQVSGLRLSDSLDG